jgi:hypothetical protein
MSTLAVLKAKVANDIARSDLTSEIATAITDAISFYKVHRFYFNETRSTTFATLNGQSAYGVSDSASIPLFLELDGMFLTDSGQVYTLERRDPMELERLLDSNASSARPWSYAFYEQSYRFYPVPDAAYTIRPVGVIEKAAPASDSETGNVWMTEAMELLRCHAKADIYTNIVRETDKAQSMMEREVMELNRLRNKTTRQAASNRIVATQF